MGVITPKPTDQVRHRSVPALPLAPAAAKSELVYFRTSHIAKNLKTAQR